MQIRMPNSAYSLSHSGDFAVSVFSAEDKGVGVDLEMERVVKAGSTKFFLSQLEKEWTSTLPEGSEQNDQILRLWTVKEALFKSDLQNEGKTVSRYVLDQPSFLIGTASNSSDRGKKTFRYSSHKFLNYWLSIAVPQT
jgi:phosphopantetheinyl transferase (holo-ACP synthase)